MREELHERFREAIAGLLAEADAGDELPDFALELPRNPGLVPQTLAVQRHNAESCPAPRILEPRTHEPVHER